MKLPLSIHAFMLAANSFTAQPVPRIIDGKLREDPRLSFPVAIFDCSSSGQPSSSDLNCVHHCSGSLISNRAVLTAAHCFTDPQVSSDSLYALVGAEDFLRPGENSELIKVSKVVNRGYGANARFPLDDDLGLAFLEHGVSAENVHVTTVRLASAASDDLIDCEEVIVAGYGRTSNLPEELRSSDGRLRIAYEHLHAPEVCIEANIQDRLDLIGTTQDDPRYAAFNLRNREFFVKERSICFGGTSASNMCNGDSGGPVVVQRSNGEYVQVGITSFGLGTGGYCGPSLDYATRVSAFSEWIAQELQEENIDPSPVFESWPLPPHVESPEFLSTRCDPTTSFQCKIAHKECIPKNEVCNGVKNCSDGSDEGHCDAKSETNSRLILNQPSKNTNRSKPWKKPKVKGDKKSYVTVNLWAGGGLKFDDATASFESSSSRLQSVPEGELGGERTIQRGKLPPRSDKKEIVFRLDPKVPKNDAVVEVLNSPAESKVKYDDEVVFETPSDSQGKAKIPDEKTIITQQHGDHVDEIRFVRRRFGHKKVVIHKGVDNDGNDEKKSETKTKEIVRRPKLPIFGRDLNNDQENAMVSKEDTQKYTEQDYAENEQVSVECVKSNLKMVSKRWEYISGQSQINGQSGHEDLTDIDAACEAMWQACKNDNPNLVSGLVGPQAGTVREFCGQVSEFHNWTQRRDHYIENFASKYHDKCALKLEEEATAAHNPLFPGPHHWTLAGTQFLVVIALFIAIIHRFLRRD